MDGFARGAFWANGWNITDLPLKFRISENPKWRRPPSWKNHINCDISVTFDQSLWNLVCWCKVCPMTAQTTKNSNFTNQRWRTAAILKTVKSLYLCNLRMRRITWPVSRGSKTITFLESPTPICLFTIRTVVRECCKGDDESQWEMGKFDPPPPTNPLTDGHQNLCT